MYDQNTSGVAAMTDYPTMEKNPDAPISLLPALEDAFMQMEKLHALINEVYIKAAPLMLATDEVMMKPMSPSDNVMPERRVFASPAAEKADMLCGSIRHAQSRIARLARELDA